MFNIIHFKRSSVQCMQITFHSHIRCNKRIFCDPFDYHKITFRATRKKLSSFNELYSCNSMNSFKLFQTALTIIEFGIISTMHHNTCKGIRIRVNWTCEDPQEKVELNEVSMSKEVERSITNTQVKIVKFVFGWHWWAIAY